MRSAEKRKVNVREIKQLRNCFGVAQMARVKNGIIERELVITVSQRQLR